MSIEAFISTNESSLRLSVFIGLFLIFAVTEFLKPRRKLSASKSKRWTTNIAIIVIDSLVVRLIFPAAAVGVAFWAERTGFGVFNLIETSFWISCLVSFVVLDFAVWFAHLLSHKVPILWRMHHSDRDIDVTTAIRFHPLEIAISMIWKVAWVMLLGAPVIAVILFEIVLNGSAMFNHSNMKLPIQLDRILRQLIVTPDMHRVHHSTIVSETDSNYGFNFPFWDRIFKTYTDQPELGHDAMKIGLSEWQDERPNKLVWSLSVPFISQTANKRNDD